jgi:hypothetical protein
LVIPYARNNEKFLGLTDDGIYQLFLKRPHGILVNQISVKKGQPSVCYVERFLLNYSKNLVLKLFLYPYFEERTISVDNFNLLLKVFGYLTSCCKQLETATTVSQIANIFKPKFSWDKVPGEDNTKLLEPLNEVGILEHTDDAKIEKCGDNNIIFVTMPQKSVIIRVDTPAHKAAYIVERS